MPAVLFCLCRLQEFLVGDRERLPVITVEFMSTNLERAVAGRIFRSAGILVRNDRPEGTSGVRVTSRLFLARKRCAKGCGQKGAHGSVFFLCRRFAPPAARSARSIPHLTTGEGVRRPVRPCHAIRTGPASCERFWRGRNTPPKFSLVPLSRYCLR